MYVGRAGPGWALGNPEKAVTMQDPENAMQHHPHGSGKHFCRLEGIQADTAVPL